jgi:general secretion pathway protein M
MKAWWQGLAERERRLLQVGAGALLLLLGWVLVWEPLDRSRADWRQRAVAAEANLQWMRSATEQLARQRAAGGGEVVTDGRSLLARVDSGAREAGLGGALLRVEPTGPDQVRVQFQQAGFDDLVQWLEQLAQQQAVRVSELSVQRAQGVGLVDARVGLEQPSR